MQNAAKLLIVGFFLLMSTGCSDHKHAEGEDAHHGHAHDKHEHDDHAHDEGHGHSHEKKPISKENLTIRANKQIEHLVKIGKIDKSWTQIKVSEIKEEVFSNKKEWLLIYSNKEISDTSKQNLYLFYTLGGRYIAANHTGK